ncbi:MAG: Gfo/Idh/MocA family oxidoreductase [candidate division KSB1 bacterium]|nr:Gfo/Idh/MocA family oxidoreductase [candidate division KSB1 bacterium]
MSAKKTIGIIGAGMIGDVHIENIRRDGRAEVTWIATRTRETLDKKKKKYGIENATTDYKDMLNDDSLDAVIIASPPFTHRDMVRACLSAGKHLLLEKPIAANWQDVQAIIQQVVGHPKQLTLECSCRHARLQPKFKFIKDIIDSGEIGEVYHIHHNALSRGTFIEYNPAGSWALQKEKAGGGAFIDWGVYDLSFHLGLLHDKPQLEQVKSFTRNGLKVYPDPNTQADIEEHGASFLEFDTGLTYYYERGSGVHFEVPNQTRIYGTRGGLQFRILRAGIRRKWKCFIWTKIRMKSRKHWRSRSPRNMTTILP